MTEGVRGTLVTNNWSVQYDGHSIIELCMVKREMSYGEIRNVIFNEGGSIDAQGIIHVGSATNKVVEIR